MIEFAYYLSNYYVPGTILDTLRALGEANGFGFLICWI